MQKNEPIMVFQEGATVVGRVVSRVGKEMIVPPDVESLYWEAMEVR